MNTVESRLRLRELTLRAIEIVRRLAIDGTVTAAETIEMREILRQAREVAYDAGYPGDAAWRALLRSNVYVTAPPADVTADFWTETLVELRAGVASLTGMTETADA